MENYQSFLEEQVVIPLNKTKLMVYLICSLAFVAGGLFFVTGFQDLAKIRVILFFVVGILGTLFFAMCAVVFCIKLFDNKPGLLITQSGIIRNSGLGKPVVILWSDVTAISEKKIKDQRFIVILTHHPDKNAGKSMTQYVPASFLETSHEELFHTLTDYWQKIRQSENESLPESQ